jgi:hypothetical protein
LNPEPFQDVNRVPNRDYTTKPSLMQIIFLILVVFYSFKSSKTLLQNRF